MHITKILDYAIRIGVPPLFWGPPGIGKSSLIRAYCRRKGYECITIIASIREPQDFGGLPVIDQQGIEVKGERYTVARLAPPDWAVKAATGERPTIVFIDEITCTPPAVQAALLRVANELVVGEFKLPAELVRVVAAANPPDQAAGGWELAPPLANRFTHHNFTLNTPDWTAQFPVYWGEAPQITFASENLSLVDWARARSLVAGYINHCPAKLLVVPKETSNAGRAWPSPRSWDAASRYLALTGGDIDETAELASGCVGEGEALEFINWMKNMDLPDPEEIIKNPAGLELPERGDQAYAILASVAAAIVNNNTPDRWSRGWDVIVKAVEASKPDIAVMAARHLAQNQPKGAKGVPSQVAALTPILKAAGLLGK